jgi:hypothetical protein
MLGRAASAFAHEAGGMRVVDHHQSAVLVGEVADLGERRDAPSMENTPSVAMSRVRQSLRILQMLFELGEIAICVAQRRRLCIAERRR